MSIANARLIVQSNDPLQVGDAYGVAGNFRHYSRGVCELLES